MNEQTVHQAPACVEDFASGSIRFRRVLTRDEKKRLSDIILHVLHSFTCVSESSLYAWDQCQLQVPELVRDLDEYFLQHRSDEARAHFVRLSTISPKDAYWVLCHNRFLGPPDPMAPRTPEAEEEVYTHDELVSELSSLRVTDAFECMMLLTHSYRTFIDLEHDTTLKGNNAIVLLPWRGDEFWYASETRVFVCDGRVLAASEYYTDVVGGYFNVPQLNEDAIKTFFTDAVAFVRAQVESGAIQPTMVVDVALRKLATCTITLVECNTYDDTVDTCLFHDMKEVEQLSTSLEVVCRWRNRQGLSTTWHMPERNT